MNLSITCPFEPGDTILVKTVYVMKDAMLCKPVLGIFNYILYATFEGSCKILIF